MFSNKKVYRLLLIIVANDFEFEDGQTVLVEFFVVLEFFYRMILKFDEDLFGFVLDQTALVGNFHDEILYKEYLLYFNISID